MKVPDTSDKSIFLYGNAIHSYLETDERPDLSELMTADRGFELASYIDDHYDLMKGYAKRMGFSDEDEPEEPFLYPLKFPSGRKPKYEIYVYGIMDRRLVNENVVDYKSRCNVISTRELKESIQFTLYLWAQWVKTGDLKKLFVLNLTKGDRKKNKKPSITLKSTTRTLDDFEKAMDMIETLWADTVINQNNEKTEGGHCFLCPYKDICKSFD